MSLVLEVADNWSNKILDTLQRFPLASISSFIVTFLLILIVESNNFVSSNFMLIVYKVTFVSTLGIFLFPALHLLSKRIWLKIFALLLLALYYYLLPLNILEPTIMVRHGLLLLALSFMFFWAPFMDIRISNQNIWEWTQNILLILLADILLSITFYLMFFGTMYSIENLFGFVLATKYYWEVVIAIIGLFSVNYFLGHLPKYIMLLQKNRYANIGAVFTKYILTPIFLIYFLLLCAYIVKIVLEKSWMSSNIDSISVGYVVIAIATYMYWTPLWDEANKNFRTLIWGSMFLLSIALGLSIWLHLESKNMEEYYLMMLFTSWLALMSIYFLFVKEASYKWLFFSISFFIVISQSEQVIDLSVNFFDKVSTMI